MTISALSPNTPASVAVTQADAIATLNTQAAQAREPLSRAPQAVHVSSVGRRLSTSSDEAARANRDKDIDEADVPSAIKDLLKQIRDLKAQIQKKQAELREIQANASLSDAQREAKLDKVRIELAGLNSALLNAYASMRKLMTSNALNDEQKKTVGMLMMK